MEFAENDRRRREAEERGRRQAEDILANREDQLYKEAVEVNQNTVDYLLGDLMDRITDNGNYWLYLLLKCITAASREAYMLVGLRKEKIDDQTNELEKKAKHSGGMIKDLMTSFLIPNIQREKLQKRSKIFIRKG